MNIALQINDDIKLLKVKFFSRSYKTFTENLSIIPVNKLNTLLFYCNPETIKTVTSWNKWSKSTKKEGFFISGDWDTTCSFPIVKEPQYKTVIELFVENKSQKDTKQFKYMSNKQKNYDSKYTDKFIDDYFKRVKYTFNSLEIDGFKTHEQLTGEKIKGTYNKQEINGISVLIGRNGEPILRSGGKHRLEMSKILGIEKIPVYLVGIHYDYAKSIFESDPNNSLYYSIINHLKSFEVIKKRILSKVII